ncbi:MAG TPA: hypothetical protein VKT49_10060 [Bryobacteraceae bacterium]|nr:hypothetical protein [Bryobacteraceae bacterium]
MKAGYAVVLGLYPVPTSMEYGVDVLRGAGFPNTNISVVFAKHPSPAPRGASKRAKMARRSKTGMVSGAIVGGALAWLIGTGVLVAPGIGPLVAAGPMTAALASLGAVGGVAGALMAWGVPAAKASWYERHIERGGALVSVHCDEPDWTGRATGVLKRTQAHEIFLARQPQRVLSAG